MGYKRINVRIDENLLKDMDALIKAGFYMNRPDLIHSALLQLEPLKKLHDERFSQKLKELFERMPKVVAPLKDFSLSEDSQVR